MKNASITAILVVCAFLCSSCSHEGDYQAAPTAKSDFSQTKAGGAVQSGGVADTAPTPAPPGVQTGIPK